MLRGTKWVLGFIKNNSDNYVEKVDVYRWTENDVVFDVFDKKEDNIDIFMGILSGTFEDFTVSVVSHKIKTGYGDNIKTGKTIIVSKKI